MISNENVKVTVDTKTIECEEHNGLVIILTETTVTYEADVLKADQPSLNGYVYSKDVLLTAIQNYGTRVFLYGELDPLTDSSVQLKNVSHRITLFGIEEDTLRVRVVTLQTSQGRALASILQQDPSLVQLVPRGLGIVDARGKVSDYVLISFDFVAASVQPTPKDNYDCSSENYHAA